MTKAFFTLPLFLLIAFSCIRNGQPNTIVYDENVANYDLTIDSIMSDTTKVLAAGLPVRFDSVDVLMHPVGFVSLYEFDGKYKRSYEKRLSSAEKRIGSDISFIFCNDSNTFSGNIMNLLFEEPLSGTTMRPLTSKVINITRINYLRLLAKATKKHYILYNVQDKDTNRDGKLNANDITTLYLSNVDGTDFEKVSPDNQVLGDTRWELQYKRFYFTTIKDINKDGKIDKRDKYSFFYVDFSSSPYQIVEYDPLALVSYN